nr:hypothetical protein [uncultured Flavobacterium sp.]
MDQAYRFEKLINHYIGTPDYVTYSTNWNNKNERVALLFTACIKEYDKHSSGETGQKLQYFMEELFNDTDKKITIECMDFLASIK